MRGHFGDVLAEDVGARPAKDAPQVLDERFAEEYQALLRTVFEVNVEVVLLDAQTVASKLFLNFFDELTFTGDFGRLD